MTRLSTMAVATLGTLGLSACVVAPYPGGHVRYVNDGYGAELAVVDLAPPPPYVETVPVAPYVGAVWIGGYWGWVGGRHAWVGGRYERPRAGFAWVPHRWVHARGRWALRGGGWVPHR